MFEYYSALGIQHNSLIINGAVQGVQEVDRPLEALLLSAINTPSTSAESLALRDALGGASDPRWLAYLAARMAPTEENRRNQYMRRVLVLLVKLFYTATFVDQGGGKVAVFNAALLQQAKTEVDAILAALPDPE